MHGSRRLLTYSNVASTLALAIALGGGTAYAAATIGSSDIIDNSVQSRDVRDGSIQSRDIRDGWVRGRDLASLSVTTRTIAAGSVTSDRVRDKSLTIADMGSSVTDAIEGQGRSRATALVSFVSDDGGVTYRPTLGFTQTLNIRGVRLSGITPGYYCLTPTVGVRLTGRPAVATPDWNGRRGEQVHVYVDSSNSECADGELAVVTNTDAGGASNSRLPFYVVVY